MSEQGESEWGLVAPFVVCMSKGGPYDDVSFVAGVQYGAARAVLTRARDAVLSPGTYAIDRWTVYSQLVPQLELLAMELGFTLRSEPWEEAPDEWTLVSLHRGPSGG